MAGAVPRAPARAGRITGRRACVLSALVWLALGLALALDTWRPVVTVDHTAAFFQFIVMGVIAAAQWIGQQAVTLAVVLAQVAVWIASAIAQFSVQVATVFVRLGDLFVKFYQHALKPFVSWSLRQIDRLQGWLERTFGPAIRLLEKIRAQIDAIYAKWFKPIFDTIDISRRILGTLAYLRVPFARELEAALGRLESRLLAPLQQIYYRLNQVIGWVNRIVTLDGLFQRITLIRSLWKYQQDALTVWWASIHRPLAGARRDAYNAPYADRSVDDHVRETTTYLRTNEAPNAGQIDEHVRTVEIELRAA